MRNKGQEHYMCNIRTKSGMVTRVGEGEVAIGLGSAGGASVGKVVAGLGRRRDRRNGRGKTSKEAQFGWNYRK